MPRYFFHVYDGNDIPDHDGIELADREEARNQAVVACGEALKELDGAFWQTEEWTMTVTDESGETVCQLKLAGTS